MKKNDLGPLNYSVRQPFSDGFQLKDNKTLRPAPGLMQSVDFKELEEKVVAYWAARGYKLEVIVQDESFFLKEPLRKSLWKRFKGLLRLPAKTPAPNPSQPTQR